MDADRIRYALLPSPLGQLLLAWEPAGLTHIHFQEGTRPLPASATWLREEGGPFGAEDQLAEYFGGRRRAFDLPLQPRGTDFQRRVWTELRSIPYGEVISYGALAVRIGQPQASRAVGAASGRNPLPIVVPCHRVVGADGRLTGYSGGVQRKEFLLELEKRVRAG